MNKNNDMGQDISEWKQFWDGLSPESEIRMWDFYGLRQWLLKYTPRFGTVLESGCGLGRNVFYLSKLGINIQGMDFEKKNIYYLNKWKKQYGFHQLKFIPGNVINLPYKDNTLSGCLSLGVVEHFIEGPDKAIKEIFRVLRPGGVAIITTPSVSFYIFFRDYILKPIKKIFNKNYGSNEKFFQYWYRAKTLKKYVNQSGLLTTHCAGADLLYSFIEIAEFNIKSWNNKTFFVKLANLLENSFLANFGAQAITISVKPAEIMHCFFCGKLNASIKNLKTYTVPVCEECSEKKITKFYKKNIRPKYAGNFIVNPEIKPKTKQICEISNKEYFSDELFEDFGFNRKIHPDILKNHEISLKLSNESIQPILRPRNQSY